MDLQDLPQVTVLERHDGPGETVRLVGHLSHLRGIHSTSGVLYISGPGSVHGDLEVPDAPGGLATVRAVAWSVPADLGPGTVLPWLDAYWEPHQVERILDREHRWERRTFAAEPAHYFELGGVRGWQKAGDPLPEGARDLGIREAGWDHEHCDLCRAHIGAGGVPEGYVDPQEYWLCPECYARYAAPHDIAFALDA